MDTTAASIGIVFSSVSGFARGWHVVDAHGVVIAGKIESRATPFPCRQIGIDLARYFLCDFASFALLCVYLLAIFRHIAH